MAAGEKEGVANGEKEITPVTFRAMLTQEEKRTGKALSALLGMKQREFWEDAMRSHIRQRRKLEEEGEFDRNEFYLVLPRDAESVGLYGDEGMVSEVVEWAEEDDVKTHTALYTALRRYLDEKARDAGMDRLDE